jgi:hypothetical protein
MKKLFKILIISLFVIFAFNCKSALNDVNWRSLIKGDWAEKNEDNISFSISDSTIVYFDSDYQYNYKTDDNKNFTVLDSNKIVLEFKILKISKDSLYIKSLNEGNKDIIYKYYKRK